MSEKVSQEDMGAVGCDAPGDNVYRMPRRSEWRRQTARRRSPLARVAKVREQVTPLRRPVPPRPSPRTPAPPTAEARQAPTLDARFYIAVRPYGTPWLIGRIPATADLELDRRAIEEACKRGWLAVSVRERTDGSETIDNPVRFRGPSSTRDMKCEALKYCRTLASILYDGADEDAIITSTIEKKLKAATVLTVDNVLEQD